MKRVLRYSMAGLIGGIPGMGFKAMLFRFKECVSIIPMLFGLIGLTGIMWVVFGIIDFTVANKTPDYFIEAMKDVYHGDDRADIRKMKKDARIVASIFIIVGVLFLAVQCFVFVYANRL